MKDPSRSDQKLIDEMSVLKQRIRELEQTSSEKIREENERRARQLTVMHETSVELTAELNLDELLHSIAQRALNLIGGAACNCYLYNPQADLLERVASAGTALIPSQKTRHRGEGMVGQVWVKGTPLLVNDYASWSGRSRAYDSFPSRALVAAPFRWGTEILGVLNIMAPLPHQYTQMDVEMLSLFAAQAAIAIRNARLHDRMKMELAERKRAEEGERRNREEAERLAEETAVIAEIGRVIGSTLDIDEVYERFAAEAKKLIPFDRLAVNLHSLHEENVRVAYTSGGDVSGWRKGDVFPLKGSISEVLIRTRAGLLNYPKTVEEIHRKFHNHDANALTAGVRSLARVPLIYRDEVIGILHFGSKTPNAYTEKDLRVAERIGSQIAGAIGSAKLFSERKQVEEAMRESEERHRTLVESASDIVFRTDETGHLTFVNPATLRITGYEEKEIIGMHYPTLIRPDMREEAIKFFGRQFVKGIPNTYSEYPVIVKDGREIWFGQNTQLIFQDGKVVAFQSVARDITDRRRIEEALKDSEKRYRELSIVDDLTQLYNSRHFYFQLKIELDRSNRYEQPLTLLLLDLDNFKTFNDTYGHVEGDQVLRRLGQVVKKCLRETDFAYRYGGEEFTILLPMTTSADGAVTAERIRTEFKKETFSPAPGQDVHVTVSIGLAQYKPKEEMKAFVHRVDQLMYQGKKNGKDRVCSES
jgi:diguanylate cyclase (GGDEF)-like protein/PAS domain S-box-containing protein